MSTKEEEGDPSCCCMATGDEMQNRKEVECRMV